MDDDRPPPAPRIHGTIARKIGIEIVGGIRRPGDILDGEIEASEELGISRTAYREAIRILAAKGLVESRPKAGTRITSRNRWNLLDPDILAWTFEGEPDTQFIVDLFELREVIEPAAAAIATSPKGPTHSTACRRSAWPTSAAVPPTSVSTGPSWPPRATNRWPRSPARSPRR